MVAARVFWTLAAVVFLAGIWLRDGPAAMLIVLPVAAGLIAWSLWLHRRKQAGAAGETREPK